MSMHRHECVSLLLRLNFHIKKVYFSFTLSPLNGPFEFTPPFHPHVFTNGNIGMSLHLHNVGRYLVT